MPSPLLTALIVCLLGIVFSIISFLIQRSVFKHMDDIKKLLENMRSEFSAFKDEVMKDFVRRCDFEKNDDAHKEMWTEINAVRDRISRMEGSKPEG